MSWRRAAADWFPADHGVVYREVLGILSHCAAYASSDTPMNGAQTRGGVFEASNRSRPDLRPACQDVVSNFSVIGRQRWTLRFTASMQLKPRLAGKYQN